MGKAQGPYANTKITPSGYLDILEVRSVPAQADDATFTITTQYHHRPDLLSYDLYGTKDYWWVFAQRNINSIKDPVYDFTAGTTIKLPKKSNLERILG
jgi:hypothetical protein